MTGVGNAAADLLLLKLAKVVSNIFYGSGLLSDDEARLIEIDRRAVNAYAMQGGRTLSIDIHSQVYGIGLFCKFYMPLL